MAQVKALKLVAGQVQQTPTTDSNQLAGLGLGVAAPAAGLAVSPTSQLLLQSNTPATFAATQNDYNPGAGSFQRLAATAAALSVTGFAAGADGRMMYITNVGANSFTLTNQAAGSVAANRIITNGAGTSITVAVNSTVGLIYDGTTARWRVIATNL